MVSARSWLTMILHLTFLLITFIAFEVTVMILFGFPCVVLLTSWYLLTTFTFLFVELVVTLVRTAILPRVIDKSVIQDAARRRAYLWQRYTWQRFEHIATTHALVFKHILERLEGGPKTLRAVNSTMRTAVNQSTTSVLCGQLTPNTDRELVEAFPNADQLICNFVEPSPVPSDDASVSLDCIAVAAPRFLSRLRVLKVSFDSGSHLTSMEGLLARLLPG
jgi:hypothetical protein